MEVIIRKWGNSPALRIPSMALKEAGYKLDQRVELVVSDGRIIIQPVTKHEYQLETLLSAITPENSHGEINFGRPVGREEF
jgi:antitoxin MazE